uniref:Uncharacterized protein MANES_08G022200 n=1 Tax=Rhizophora mucronata TaxID=61149 RepID=A0A2P2QNX8_RHIMU
MESMCLPSSSSFFSLSLSLSLTNSINLVMSCTFSLFFSLKVSRASLYSFSFFWTVCPNGFNSLFTASIFFLTTATSFLMGSARASSSSRIMAKRLVSSSARPNWAWTFSLTSIFFLSISSSLALNVERADLDISSSSLDIWLLKLRLPDEFCNISWFCCCGCSIFKLHRNP